MTQQQLNKIRERYNAVKHSTKPEIVQKQIFDSVPLLLDEVEQLKAERDAAVADLKKLTHCKACVHDELRYNDSPCCVCVATENRDCWKWRGVQRTEENEP